MRRFAYRSMKKSQFPLSAPSAKTGILACSVAREDMQKPPATDCVATTPFNFFPGWMWARKPVGEKQRADEVFLLPSPNALNKTFTSYLSDAVCWL